MINTSISLVMYGIRKCSGNCLYCSAASTMAYRDKKNGNKKSFRFDKEKTKKRILEYTGVLENLKNNESTELSIDIWGGNPVENFEEFKQVVDFCYNDLKEFHFVKLHTSGNGLELQSDDIVQYLIDNNIHYQISHDGLGQWLRTGEIDPFYWDKTKNNIAKMVKMGLLDWINCTLNEYNHSFFENIKYFNKWRKDYDILQYPLYIKLNHIAPGSETVDKKWYGKDIQGNIPGTKPCKKGQVIGDLCFSKESLTQYFHELRKLALICMAPGMGNSEYYGPYVEYITEQVGRWNVVKDDAGVGSCRSFQMGIRDTNFAIDTIGEYCQCNLVDSSAEVKNHTGWRPDECKDCIYTNQAECYHCGSEKMTVCNKGYDYQWCQVLEEFAQLKELLASLRNENNQNHECNCNGDGCCGGECSCESDKNKDAVYCVKNYRL